MKTIIAFLYLLPLAAFGQINKSIRLKLSTGDCRENKSVRIGYRDTIQFFQNDQLTKQIIPMDYTQWPIDIINFSTGKYTVFYRNLYGEKVSKLITVPDTSGEYALRLCPDELLEYKSSSLFSLQENEKIEVNFSSQGCFNQEEKILTITKKDNSFIAKLSERDFHGNRTQSVKLDQQSIESFKRFENEIRKVHDHGCTTVDTYIITSKSWVLTATDGGCAWDGFYFLKTALFGMRK
jgi:hypothetical protein